MKYFSHKIVWYLNIFSLQGPELSHIRDRARIWQLCRKVGKYFVKHIQHLIRSKQYAWENCRRSLVKHYWIQTDLSKKVRIWHLIFTFDWYSSGCNQTLCMYFIFSCSRSACESPSRAMSLVTAASLVTGTSSKYSGLVSLVRGAAQHGLGGGDCNTL